MTCIRNLCFAVVAVLAWAIPASAQERITIEVWIVEIHTRKVLPAGHHHFVPVPADMQERRIPSGEHVLCSTFGGAISLGKRLWEKKTPHQAAAEIRAARGGETLCGTLQRPSVLQPVEIAIRSHDGVHRVHVLKLRDETGRVHFTASPVKPGS